MNESALNEELQAAYKNLDRKEDQIKNLLLERKQLHMTIELLETAGFIKEGKLEEARGFVSVFKCKGAE